MGRRKCCCCPPCDAIAAEAAEEDQPDVIVGWGNPSITLQFVAAASPWVWFGSIGTDPPPEEGDHYWEISLALKCDLGLWNIQGHILHRYKSGTVYSCYYQFDYSFPCVVPAPLTVDGSGYFVGTLILPGGSAEQKLGGFNCPDNDPYANPIDFIFGP